MTTTQGHGEPLEVLFVGSAPFPSTDDFMKTVMNALPHQLKQLSDSEPGDRGTYVLWQGSKMPPGTVKSFLGHGDPTPEAMAKSYTLEDIKPTQYDDAAIQSYQTFKQLRASGIIPADMKFQVGLPTAPIVLRVFFEGDELARRMEPLYKIRLLQALKRIQEEIPANDLIIQLDIVVELLFLEYERGRLQNPFWKPYFLDPSDGGAPEDLMTKLVGGVAEMASNINSDVELGFHLCYGDWYHRHEVEPEDTGLMVDFANRIAEAINKFHKIKYFHMPVPKERTDEAYFAPLKGLSIADETKIFLGVVHAHDREGSTQRLRAATAVYPKLAGIASECGLGRTPAEEIGDILQTYSALTVLN